MSIPKNNGYSIEKVQYIYLYGLHNRNIYIYMFICLFNIYIYMCVCVSFGLLLRGGIPHQRHLNQFGASLHVQLHIAKVP